ncbi:MAG: HAD family phosphatase [Pseudomonadales bacterium]
MRDFKAAIFDMDGLMLDSERLALNAFQATCSTLELGDLSWLFKRCVGTNAALGRSILKDGLKGIANHMEFGSIWDDNYRKLIEERPVPLKDGVEQLLRHLQSVGIRTAVATSTKTGRAESKLQASGIIDYFEIIVGGDQVVNGKPEPDIYIKAAAELSQVPGDCIALEDSANGVRSALSAGMTVVQIPDLFQPDEPLLAMGHIVLRSLSDVVDHDFSLNK